MEPSLRRGAIDDIYADKRIAEKIAVLADARARDGLREVNASLKRARTPASTRLHLVTAVIHLGHLGEESLPRRIREAGRTRKAAA